jgi:hypothetical protein
MRKSLTISFAAMLFVAALTGSAHAGKYQCSFYNGSSPIHQCDIESGASGSGYYCQKAYNASMMGTCLATKWQGGDRLQCVYHNPNKSIADLAADAAKGDTKILSEKPGFIAGGVTAGAPANLVLVGGYQESGTAPLFQVLCTAK